MSHIYPATSKILALSSSRVGNSGYLEVALPHIKKLLGPKKSQIAFIPFALVSGDYAAYSENVRNSLVSLPHELNTVCANNAKRTIEEASVIMTGGGNTFKLLYELYNQDLLNLIQSKIQNGTPYIGWSAGSNILSPGIYTTNDMPVIQPLSFKALNMLPFQLNPHYNNELPAEHRGETRDQRLEEFLLLNPSKSIIGLREGTGLLVENREIQLIGDLNAVHFSYINKEIIKQEMNADQLFLELNTLSN